MSNRSEFSWSRVFAFMTKETMQIYRDPSSIMIAVILPLIMIFLFAYGVSLDTQHIKVGLVLEDSSPQARSLYNAFANTPYFQIFPATHRQELTHQLVRAEIHGLIVIPEDFTEKLLRNDIAAIQVIADGSETNTATFIQNYSDGVVALWWKTYLQEKGVPTQSVITPQVRVWFNEELESRNVILPGSIAIIMALIGTLLTALVVAREWDNGTMETLLTTPIRMSELIFAKVTPYFILGLGSMTLCVCLAVFVFKVPFHGKFLILLLASSLFLIAALSQGLLISTLSKNQFAASQAAINAAFLPAYMLSGFLYEIESMPTAIKMITYILPARYFVSIIQSSFLAGFIWHQVWFNLLGMLIIGSVFMYLVYRNTRKKLE
jgi:ABC-2 type transport system permease protein